MTTRVEKDSMGEINVPSNHYWGAQTQRSLLHFSIGTEKMPMEIIYALALYKKCAAKVNYKLHLITKPVYISICDVVDQIISKKLNDEFPLFVWQTGSGTQTNMNINEVIANYGKHLYPTLTINPNDDVNRSQSSNDSFISAVHIAVAFSTTNLLSSIKKLQLSFEKKCIEFSNDIKLGRTHLEDAVPLTVGQEFSGYVSLIRQSKKLLKHSLKAIYELAAGGTAVGTGLNAPKNFGKLICHQLEKQTGLPFTSSSNKFASLSSHNALLQYSDAMKMLATNLMKIANDIRWLASGPRSGLGEIIIPQNEPGSSIMPGKINPTQCEAVTMIAIQVISNNNAITFANSQGNFELNVFKPLIAYNIFQSIKLLTDVCTNFSIFCIDGIQVNKKQIAKNVENALSLVTALTPVIGYEKSATLSQYAHKHNLSIKEANDKLHFIDNDELIKRIDPRKMI
jgi:fumarate hydratase class II